MSNTDAMKNEGVGSWISRRCRIARNRTALVFEGRTWTYGQFGERIDRLANALVALGVRFGDRVGYLGPNHPSFLELLFAAGSIGAIPLPINFRLTADEIAYIVDDAGCRVLLYGPEVGDTAGRLRGARGVSAWVALDPSDGSAIAYEELVASAPTTRPDIPVGLHDVGLMVYTSGTTGRPKGVMLTHGNLTWNAINFLTVGDFRSEDISLAIAPFFRVGGLAVTVLQTLLVGGTVVLMGAFEPRRAVELIERHGVTILFGGPDLLQALEDEPSFAGTDFSSVRVCYTGGAPVPEQLLNRWLARNIPIRQGYGLSEAAPAALLLDSSDASRKVGSAGRPMFFTDVRVVRRDLEDCAPGEVGEILVRGPNVMRGYWNRPEATEQALVAGEWLCTGDAARLDNEGYVYVVGRISDAYETAGGTVFPGDVERVLLEHPAIRDAAVVGVSDAAGKETGVGFVVPDERLLTDAHDILLWAADRLDRRDVLREVRFIEAIPRNPAGKVLRHELRALAQEPD